MGRPVQNRNDGHHTPLVVHFLAWIWRILFVRHITILRIQLSQATTGAAYPSKTPPIPPPEELVINTQVLAKATSLFDFHSQGT